MRAAAMVEQTLASVPEQAVELGQEGCLPTEFSQ
jgi:hypothetical protein